MEVSFNHSGGARSIGSRRRFGRLRHFVLAPNFGGGGIKERLFLQEVMRQSDKIALFKRIFPPVPDMGTSHVEHVGGIRNSSTGNE